MNINGNRGQQAPHVCNWPGCEKTVDGAFWACRNHTRQLPYDIRDRLTTAIMRDQPRVLRRVEGEALRFIEQQEQA